MSITKNITKRIIWLYESYVFQNEHEKKDTNPVQLGRSFKIADRFQFKFARSISKKLTSSKILVDYPISCTNRSQPIYPDLLLIDDNKIKGIVEIKIDLGFFRYNDFGITYKKENKTYSYDIASNKFCHKYSNFLRSEEIWYKTKSKKKRVDLKVTKAPKKIFIVVSRKNHENRIPFFKQSIKDANFKALFLLDEIHPNKKHATDDLIKKEISNKRDEIEKLFNGL